MCDITFYRKFIRKTKKAIKLAKNNANFVMKIILTCENGGGGGQAEV